MRRRGYTVRYCGDDAVYDTRKGTQGHLRSDTHDDGDQLDSDQYALVLSSNCKSERVTPGPLLRLNRQSDLWNTPAVHSALQNYLHPNTGRLD